MFNSKKLFWAVFKCNGEKSLHEIVCTHQLFKNPDNWYPYGGKSKDDRSNFGTFENQQNNSGAALVEKITNSIDALLLKKCKQENIDPKSKFAPSEMEEATAKFFAIPNGDIGDLLSKDRTQMARDNMQIIATGGKNEPDIMIYDYGEGQHPDNFKNTFLSIANNNKTDIPFVQGKYNMGSTGAVVYCGKYRYQLIASKMDSVVFDKQSKHTDNLFGWTLVRRHVLTAEENANYGSSWYEYFAINGENIPQFEIEKLDIGLHGDNKYFTTGSFIKLYSYEMPRGAKGPINTHLYREFNQLLYKPALPFWLFEKRGKYDPEQKNTNAVYGNHVRINNTDNEEYLLEITPIYEQSITNEIGIMTIHVIVFKKGHTANQEKERKRSYIGDRHVIYTLNGQVQGSEGKSFITQDLKYNFLKDSMLIVIDCSKINTNFRQDLFMANRSDLRKNDKLVLLRRKVIEILKGNDSLRQINTQRKNSILQGGDANKEMELIKNLLSRVPLDKSLTDLLKKGADLINILPQKTTKIKDGKAKKVPLETKRFPSIFKIDVKENKDDLKKIKSIPLNGKGIIRFETDVAEDYFYRPQEKGDFQIKIFGNQNRDGPVSTGLKPNPNLDKVEDIFEVNKSGPANGSIKLTLQPKNNLKVGDEIKLNAKLTSPNGDIESIFYVKIVNPQKQEKIKMKENTEKTKFPKLIKITKTNDGNWQQDNGNAWNEVADWDESSIIHIMPDDQQKKVISAIAINMDSYSLQKFLSKNNAKSETDITYLKHQYISKIYLHGLFLYSILDKLDAQETSKGKYAGNTQSSDELLAKIFKNYSDVLIHLDTNTKMLKLFDDE